MSYVSRLLICITLLFAFPESVYANSKPPFKVSICEDDTEVFPLTYYSRDNGIKNSKVTGFTIEIIERTFRKYDIDWKIDLIPWSRCLKEVKKGKHYQMLLNAVTTEERRLNYHFSEPHYTTQNYYFYSKSKYPDGLKIHSPNDLAHYVLAGVYGYDQTVFGVKNEDVLIRSKSLPKLIKMLYLDRFDVFMAGNDITYWMRYAFPELNINHSLGYAPLQGTKKTEFYFMLSKQWKDAKRVQALLDKEIALMKRDGAWVRLLKKYSN